MSKLYIFTGLGTDKRVFREMDLSGLDITYINWIEPLKTERIEDYALRLTSQINTLKPILIGLSFGGIIAVEVAKCIATEKVILIASAKNKYEIPWIYRLAGSLKLNKFLPLNLLKQANFLSYWFFGIHNRKDKKLLSDILKDTDPLFLEWAIEKIVNWKNVIELKHKVHIHGEKDRILPIRNIDFDIKVMGGGHFMTVNRGTELTKIVRSELAKQA